MSGRLDGKVALITGSDSGIGQGTAIEFAWEGADVVVTFHDDERGAIETRRLVEEAGRRAMVVQVDTSDETSVGAMFDAALEAFGMCLLLAGVDGLDAMGCERLELVVVDPSLEQLLEAGAERGRLSFEDSHLSDRGAR